MMDERWSGIRCYRFGAYVLDLHRSRLWRHDLAVPVTPKVLDVLGVLVERAGQVVPKDELLRLVWPETVVEENNLARNISNLRKVLQERRDQHEYIVTVPGQGYRFVAPVTVWPTPASSVGSSGSIAGLKRAFAPMGAPRARAAVLTVPILLALAWAAQPWFGGRGGSGPEAEVNTRRLYRTTFGGGLDQNPSWAPDGQWLVYASDQWGDTEIVKQAVGDPAPLRLTTSPGADWQPAWSPDGQRIAFRSERQGGGIFVMPAGGGPATRLTESGFRPQWSSSGRWVLFASSHTERPRPGVWIVEAGGGRPRPLRPDVLGAVEVIHATWHPREDAVSVWGQRDGESILLTVPPQVGDPVASAIGRDVRDRLEKLALRPMAFTWARSARFLYLEGESDGVRNVWRISVDPGTLALTGGPERLTIGPGHDTGLALSPDGRRLALTVRTSRTRLWQFPFDTRTATLAGVPEPVTSGGVGAYDAAATGDGRKLAFRAVRGNRMEVWQQELTGGGPPQLLLTSTDRLTSPRWSRDGTMLAYARGDAIKTVRPRDIVLLRASSGEEQILEVPGEFTIVPDDWGRDGTTILGACRHPGSAMMGTCLLRLTESRTVGSVRLIAADPRRTLICQRFSPDERWISFMAVDRSARNQSTLYVMPSIGGEWIQMTDGLAYDDKPRWSADGRTLLFLSDRGGMLNLWGQRFDPDAGRPLGQAFQVTDLGDPARLVSPHLAMSEIAVAADRVFLPVTESSAAVWMLEDVDR